MDPQCEMVGKYILPIYRSLLARELVEKYDFSQTQAAKRLGTTQAAISQYLSSKRAFKGIEHVEQYLPKITQVREIASQNNGIFKRLSYYLRERRAEKKLKNFRDELLFKQDSLLLRL